MNFLERELTLLSAGSRHVVGILGMFALSLLQGYSVQLRKPSDGHRIASVPEKLQSDHVQPQSRDRLPMAAVAQFSGDGNSGRRYCLPLVVDLSFFCCVIPAIKNWPRQ